MTKNPLVKPERLFINYDAAMGSEVAKYEKSHAGGLDAVCSDTRIFEFADRRIAEYHRFMRCHEMAVLADAMEKCESPIEKYMLIALRFVQMPLFVGPSHDTRLFPVSMASFNETAFKGRHPHEGVELYPQAAVDKYRVDFLIVCKFCCSDTLYYIVVECDGHEYHERTKEQAARDKNRDREMATLGCHVLRFTGSEIVKDANKCAEQVAEFIHELEFREREKAAG